MSFEYPKHFKYPDERIFFTDHIQSWEFLFSDLKNKPNICLEIGALYGGASVYILENLCKFSNSHHYIMDINNNQYLENNLKPYDDRVTLMLGESCDTFKYFEHNGIRREFLDFVYVDGNHLSKYVLEDAVNSFYCLKNDGIIVFDDYAGGLEQEQHLQVKTGVDAFLYAYRKYVEVIFSGYQLILRKKFHIIDEELKINYYNNVK
jgi:predicted O-methyltransferase YrrM